MDIDKYKTSEIALNRSLELITKSNDQLKNFTYILSHNIRNHASNLQLVSSLINTESLDQENAELFDMLKNISKGLDSTLEDLAQALKIREGTVTSEQLDFEVTATKATDILSLDLNINKAKIIFELAVKQINFPGIYLESIILNLISNAIKYRRPEVDPLITLRTYKNSSGNTVLECEDNGLGIDLNLHGHKIFGLYKTFHGNKGAHGIGLFLVKLQVESQGGMIEVESTLGKGTIFKITFNE
jgi:light-regulated signal transduction histidine kinase (bacteriophytochrome)